MSDTTEEMKSDSVESVLETVNEVVKKLLVSQQLSFTEQCAKREQEHKARAESVLQNAQEEAKKIIAAAENTVADLIKEKRAWETEKEKIGQTQKFVEGGVIKLNVGGTIFATSMSTLCKFPNSLLGAMFRGDHTIAKDADGYYFLDKDGTHFRHILNFLRDPEKFKLVDDMPAQTKSELRIEAEFYGLLDVMFPSPPFIPAQPCQVQDPRYTYSGLVTVTQDNNGLWYGEVENSVYDYSGGYGGGGGDVGGIPKTLLQVCGCGCAFLPFFIPPNYDTEANFRMLNHFTKTREVRPEQPKRKHCENCRAAN